MSRPRDPIGVPFGAGPVWGKPLSLPFELDEHQHAVVEWEREEAVCAAAAGSGKTTVLIERIVHLLTEKGEVPEGVLTLAYNKDAADEFRTRLMRRLGPIDGSRAPVYTFHAWCLNLLKTWFPQDLKWHRILGGREQKERGRDRSRRGAPLPSKAKVWFEVLDQVKPKGHEEDWKYWADWYDRARDGRMPPYRETSDPRGATILEWVMKTEHDPYMADDNPPRAPWPLAACKEHASMAVAYDKAKKKYNCCDFSDMTGAVGYIMSSWRAAGCPEAVVQGHAAQPHPLHQLTHAYRHVQVDEAQDLNAVRWVIAEHLGYGARSLLSCGDVRQSLYGFNGAQPYRLIDRVKNHGATLLTLPVNRRSTRAIVAFSNDICDGEDWNLGGNAEPKPGAAEGPSVQVWDGQNGGPTSESQGEETSAVTTDIQIRVSKGAPYSAFACLFRTNAAIIPMEVGMIARDIPAYVLGREGGSWDSEPGRDLIGALRAAADIPHKSAWSSAVKFGTYVRGRAFFDAVEEAAKGHHAGSLQVALRKKGRATGRVADLFQQWGRLQWPERCQEIADRFIEHYSDVTGLSAEDVAAGDDDVIAVYQQLAEAAIRLGSLENINKAVKAARQAAKSGNAVALATVHRAKGKEWSVVYGCQVAQGVLPHKKADDLAEELRIFYVMCTRPKDVLVLSPGSLDPSPFLESVLDERASG